MRRLIMWVILGAGVAAVARRLRRNRRASPTLAERMAAKCEQMLAQMPESFPPKRMMADLETVTARTALILEKLDGDTADRDRAEDFEPASRT